MIHTLFPLHWFCPVLQWKSSLSKTPIYVIKKQFSFKHCVARERNSTLIKQCYFSPLGLLSNLQIFSLLYKHRGRQLMCKVCAWVYVCGRGGGCCQNEGGEIKLARVTLNEGFYVKEVPPAQLKRFMLARKENGVRHVTANRCTMCYFWSA